MEGNITIYVDDHNIVLLLLMQELCTNCKRSLSVIITHKIVTPP